MTLRQDHQLQQIDAYALDKSDNALLLKHAGIATLSKTAKSKLMGIDPATKALLVRWIGAVPPMTGAQIVAILEALTEEARLKADAIRIEDTAGYFTSTEVESALTELALGTAIQNDVIHDFHIDWGTGANQVSAVDVPILDAAVYFIATEVEAALAELATGVAIQNLAIKDYHIDFGTGANQVSAVDIPIADAGAFFVATEVEAALQELALAATITIADVGGFYAAANIEAALQEIAAPTWLISRLEAATGDVWEQQFNNWVRNGSFELWSAGAAAAPDEWTLSAAGGESVARQAATIRLGEYSMALTRVGNDCYLYQNVITPIDADTNTYWRGRKVVAGCWVYANVGAAVRFQIYDGVGAGYSSFHPGDSAWHFLTVTRTLHANATVIAIYLQILTTNDTAYFDGCILTEGTICPPFVPSFLEDHGTVVVDVDETKFSHKVPIRIGGIDYYVMLTQT